MINTSISEDQARLILRDFLLSSPPGQTHEVLKELKELLPEQFFSSDYLKTLFEHYHHTNYFAVAIPNQDHKVCFRYQYKVFILSQCRSCWSAKKVKLMRNTMLTHGQTSCMDSTISHRFVSLLYVQISNSNARRSSMKFHRQNWKLIRQAFRAMKGSEFCLMSMEKTIPIKRYQACHWECIAGLRSSRVHEWVCVWCIYGEYLWLRLQLHRANTAVYAKESKLLILMCTERVNLRNYWWEMRHFGILHIM